MCLLVEDDGVVVEGLAEEVGEVLAGGERGLFEVLVV